MIGVSQQGPKEGGSQPRLMPLPRIEELPVAENEGFGRDAVARAFQRFELYVDSLRGQVRELQAARPAEPADEAPATVSERGGTRADALQLVQAAAAFAETLERDAQEAARRAVASAEEEVRERVARLAERETEVAKTLRELDATRETFREEARRAAEAEAARIVEDARAQAADVVRKARGEVERQLEWARAQSAGVLRRARAGAAELQPAIPRAS